MVLFGSLGLIIYATVTFLPGHLIMWAHFFGYGQQDEVESVGGSYVHMDSAKQTNI